MTGTLRSGPGRHRLGTAGLRYCRDIGAVGERLGGTGPGRRPVGRRGGRLTRAARWLTTVGGAIVAAVLAVSGWYTAAGASAVAQMIAR